MALLSDAELRRRLQQLGEDVGPITDTTRAAYQRLLRKRQGGQQPSRSAKRPRMDSASAPAQAQAGTLSPKPAPKTPSISASASSPSSSKRLSARQPHLINVCSPLPRDPGFCAPHEQSKPSFRPSPPSPLPSSPSPNSPSDGTSSPSTGERLVSAVAGWLKAGVRKLVWWRWRWRWRRGGARRGHGHMGHLYTSLCLIPVAAVRLELVFHMPPSAA